jgi:DNA-binding transcriptional ArsR family regulator
MDIETFIIDYLKSRYKVGQRVVMHHLSTQIYIDLHLLISEKEINIVLNELAKKRLLRRKWSNKDVFLVEKKIFQ